VSDPDIWRAAAILVKRHGANDAAIVAVQRGDEFRAKGDEDGYAIWKAILDAGPTLGWTRVLLPRARSPVPVFFSIAAAAPISNSGGRRRRTDDDIDRV
jgi:hypothetical protein